MPTPTADGPSPDLASQDKRMPDLKLDLSSELTSSSPQAPPQRKTLTTVEITPIRATAEINDAIKRQKRTGGLSYSKSHPGVSHARPLFRAVLTGNIHPSQAQCTIATTASPGSLNNGTPDLPLGRFHGNGINSSNGHIDAGSSRSSGGSLHPHSHATSGKKSSPTSPFPVKTGAASGSWNSSSSGYSIVYDKQGKMTTVNVVNSNSPNGNVCKYPGETNGVHSVKQTSRNPRLTFTHRSKGHVVSDYPSGFNRSLSADPNTLTLSSNDKRSAEQPKHSSHLQVGNSRAAPSSEEKQANVTETFSSQSVSYSSHKTSPATTTTSVKLSPRSTSISASRELIPVTRTPGLQKSRSLDSSKGPAQKPSTTGVGMTCLQFADSVLGAIGSDLNQVYQLCQAKVRYAEFLELSHSHKHIDSNNNIAKDGDQCLPDHKEAMPGPSPSFTSLPSAYKSPHGLAPLPLAQFMSPRTKMGLSGFPTKTKLATSVVAPGQSTSSKLEVIRDEASLTTEIDYDKPVTIIIDSDHVNQSMTKTSRSILKTPTRMDNVSNGNDSWMNGNSHTHSVPPYLSLRNAQTENEMRAPSRKDPNVSEDQGEVTTSLILKKNNYNNKGRLVRFSTDHKIHEFVPLEPVTPKSDPF